MPKNSLFLEQGRIHGQYQSRTGGQGWKCAFSHFPTQSPQTDQRRIHLHRKKNTKTHLRLKGNVKKSDEKQEMRSIESDRNSLQFACQGARTVSTFITS